MAGSLGGVDTICGVRAASSADGSTTCVPLYLPPASIIVSQCVMSLSEALTPPAGDWASASRV